MTITTPDWLWVFVKWISIAGADVGFFLLCLFAWMGWRFFKGWK